MMDRTVAVLLVFFSVLGLNTAAQNCPTGWTYFQMSCYLLVPQNVTWFEARVACKALNSNLVHIESADENTFLTRMLNNVHVTHAWIGLLDMAIDNIFLWDTIQEAPEYTNWLPNQPDNAYGNEDCGELQFSGFWNDNKCHAANMAFICESLIQDAGGAIVG